MYIAGDVDFTVFLPLLSELIPCIYWLFPPDLKSMYVGMKGNISEYKAETLQQMLLFIYIALCILLANI